MGKEALVVPRNVLLENAQFQGFMKFQEHDFISVILKNHFYHARGDNLENDKSLQQVIPYVWIVNPATKSVFLYKRAINQNKAAGEFREERYMNKYSGGVGGHIDQDTEAGTENPIGAAMMRELKEEVLMTNYPQPQVIGYIKDDSDSIGTVHFGVVAIAETSEEVKSKEEEGLAKGAFYSVKEVDEIMSDPLMQVENWTKISWPHVKSYIVSLK